MNSCDEFIKISEVLLAQREVCPDGQMKCGLRHVKFAAMPQDL